MAKILLSNDKMKLFNTFKPISSVLQKYISYYYIDIADNENYRNEYICYPHYNNTITIYKNHTGTFSTSHSIISFDSAAMPLQVFTPLREYTLKVTQIGAVHKIGIVFKPFGINQFLANRIPINQLISSPAFCFFKNDFILTLFEQSDFGQIAPALDDALLALLSPIQNIYIEEAIQFFETHESELRIDELAVRLGVSRKHLNRLFKKHIGTTAQKYRSIIRFRQLMNHKLHTQDSLTSLSHRAYYSDQSHFIKECKFLTGVTPLRFFRDGTILGEEDTFWKFTG
jgi:AraC-like DNA-binding protein